MRIAVVANSAWYLFNFRRRLMHTLQGDGHQVVAMSPADAYAAQLRSEHLDWVEWRLAFTYTPKANIYTGLAARGLPLAHVPNVSGLGRAFIDRGALTRLVVRLYRLAFGRAHVVVFQNEDDRGEFLAARLVEPARTLRVPGSGVDLDRFTPVPLPPGTAPVFLFIGRVLGDKGVREYVDAARRIRRHSPQAVFRILGSVSADNPTAIPAEEVRSWVDESLVELLGTTDDVRPAIAAAHGIVLPSYREGVPRVLLEAAAMARPCIATDVPG